MNNPKNIKIHTDLAQKLVKLGVFEEFLQACNDEMHQLNGYEVREVAEGFTWDRSLKGQDYWQSIAVKCGESL